MKHTIDIIMRRFAALALCIGACSVVAVAQNYYDDDIYDNPSKPKKSSTKKTSTQKNSNSTYIVNDPLESGTYVFSQSVDFPASDTYVFDSGSTRDIDEYNRRGIFADANKSEKTDSLGTNFEYTQRLVRFHNPELIENSTDQDLVAYYTEAVENPESTINVYVVNDWGGSSLYDPWGWNWPYRWNTWYGPSWSWSWGWGSPWYSPWYTPLWAWGWYDPWFSWGWGGPIISWGWGGPGWYPGWGPAWYPGHGPGHGPGIAWRPSSGPGASQIHGSRPGSGASAAFNRPGTPASTVVGSRPGANQRPGAATAASGARPNASARPGSATTTRPSQTAAAAATTRPGARPGANINYRPGDETRLGNIAGNRVQSTGGVTTRPGSAGAVSRPSTGVSGSHNNSVAPSRQGANVNRGSSTSAPSRSSGSFNSGGSRGGGSFGGGGSRGGGGHSGGGGRGGRR